MKIWAYIHPDLKTLCCALIKEAVPEGVNAVEFEVNSTDDIVLDNGEIRLKTDAEKLAEAKQKAINDLSQKASTYILQYYSDTKQRSDVSDKENGESYLAYKGLDTNAIRKDITSAILSNTDFQTVLNTLNQKYNTNNDQMISYWLSQVLKIGYRQYFVFQVKQEYVSYIQQIQQATSLPLPSFEFKTPFPQLP
jgi:vacuolar-type H+-ATPase subunit I/STV1